MRGVEKIMFLVWGLALFSSDAFIIRSMNTYPRGQYLIGVNEGAEMGRVGAVYNNETAAHVYLKNNSSVNSVESQQLRGMYIGARS